MKHLPDYAALALQAEKAVEGVKDAELKRIAFQRILDSLIGGHAAEMPPTARPKKQSQASKNSSPKGGPKGYVEELVEGNFFKTPKTITEVKSALEDTGHHIAVTSLSGPLQKLCQQKKLRRSKYPTSGTYCYSNW